jgi:membrane protein YqaA with SNARE-associated domain
MIQRLPYILLIFIAQEQTSTNALLLYMKQRHISPWPLLCAWILLTALDLYLGYVLGQSAHRRASHTKIGGAIDKAAKKFEGFLGYRNESIVLILLGIFNFPYVNAFLCSWLRLDFKRMFLCLMIGDVIAYALSWGTVSWLSRFIPNPLAALGAVILATLCISLIVKAVLKHQRKRPSEDGPVR